MGNQSGSEYRQLADALIEVQMHEEEIWKTIPGFDDRYEASTFGNIRSITRVVEKSNGMMMHITGSVLTPYDTEDGYKRIALYCNGKMKHFLVHRLIAITFIDNKDNLPEVNHKDENKTNNRVDNLEWCTHEYNMIYGTGRKRQIEHCTNNHNSMLIYQYTLEGELVAVWPSMREISRVLGYDQGMISKCVNGKQKTSHGYKWRSDYV